MPTWMRQALGKVSPEELAARELYQARCSLLDAQSTREYAAAMVTFYEQKIDRLRATLDIAREQQ